MAARTTTYSILIIVAVGVVVAQLMAISDGTIKDNDRSRWATVRSLNHDGAYAIGHRVRSPDGRFRDQGIFTEPGWGTVDRVLDPERGVFYSSKPPLLPSLVAGVYWVVRAVTGWSILDYRLPVVRLVLLVVNVLPLIAYLAVLGRLVHRLGETDWGRVYVFAAGCFGTFITTFAVVLNNHTPAAYSTLFAVACALRAIAPEGGGGPRAARPVACMGAGFFAGCAAAFDLPAASFAALLGFCVGWKCGLRACGWFGLGLAAPVIAWVATNYAAIGQVSPAYSHTGGSWYIYEGSPWHPAGLRGIERAGEAETRLEYIFHLTLGHHGLFSLTPVFILALWILVVGRPDECPPNATGMESLGGPRLGVAVSWMTLALVTVMLGFYGFRTSNYGGLTVGPRWLFWLTPLLLLSAVPAADALGRYRLGRAAGALLLVISVFSAMYKMTDPWSHPWLYQLMVTVDPSLAY